MWEERGEKGWVDGATEESRDSFTVRTDLSPPRHALPPEVSD